MKRYGPVGSKWNSRKYLRMHNESISRGLKAYWANKKNNEENFEACGVVALILFIALMILIIIKG